MRFLALAVFLSCAVSSGAAKAEKGELPMAPEEPFCTEIEARLSGERDPDRRMRLEDQRAVCRLPHDDLTPAGALTMLQGEDIALRVDGGAVTIVARNDGGQTRLCCSLQGEMTRFPGTDLWATRYRLERIEEAVLWFISPTWSGENGPLRPLTWRGTKAPPQPPQLSLQEAVAPSAGEIVSRQFWSDALGETRRVDIYLPTERSGELAGVLISADGLPNPLIVEHDVRDGRYAPLAVVGLPSGERGIVEDRSDLGIDDLRAADYIPWENDEHDRFNRHQAFVFEELLPALTEEFDLPGGRSVIVTGDSNGAVFALYAALDRFEEVRAAIVNSPGRDFRKITPDDGESCARFHVSAGLYEPSFRYAARKIAADLAAIGCDSAHREYAAGHAPDQWELALTDGLRALLGDAPAQ